MKSRTKQGVHDHGLARRPWPPWGPWLLVGAGSLLLAWRFHWFSADNDARLPGDEMPSIVAQGAHRIIVRDHGQIAWECSAARIEISPDHQFVTAIEVDDAALYRDGKPYLHLRAGQVKIDQFTRDMSATGGVHGTGPDGFSVSTDQAKWKQALAKLFCPGDVQATLQGMSFHTRDIDYNTITELLECPQKVSMASPRVSVEGTNALVDGKNRQVKFNGAVDIAIQP